MARERYGQYIDGVGFYIFRYILSPMATGEASTREAQLRKPFASPFFPISCSRCSAPPCAGDGGACYGPRSPPSRYFVGRGIYSGYVLRDPAFELNCFLTRGMYLGVMALMLGYLSTYEGEVRIALAARRANGDNGGQAAPRGRPPRWAAPMADRNEPATGNRAPPGRDGSRDRWWKPDPSKGCSRPSNAERSHASGSGEAFSKACRS